MSRKEKSVQIPEVLFVQLARYFLLDMQDTNTANYIKRGLQNKLDSIARHELYTQYKTAPTPEQQEQARQDYLNAVGVPSDFRY